LIVIGVETLDIETMFALSFFHTEEPGSIGRASRRLMQ